VTASPASSNMMIGRNLIESPHEIRSGKREIKQDSIIPLFARSRMVSNIVTDGASRCTTR
jgi:hypothetical protein